MMLKLHEMLSNRRTQQNMMMTLTESNQKATLASMNIVHRISRCEKPFMGGKLIKECIEDSADVICSDRKTKKTI